MQITTENAVYTSYPSKEWIVDFDSGFNQAPDSTLSAISQDLKFAISVERFKYPIMGSNFGITLLDLIGKDYGFIRSEIETRIKDALSIDDRVESVDSFTFELVGDNGLLVSCIAHTSQGDVNLELSVGE